MSQDGRGDEIVGTRYMLSILPGTKQLVKKY